MATCRGEIHVTDTTLFRMRVKDDCVAFDPSLATIKELVFELPGGGTISKTATLTNNGSPATEWYLEYQVIDGDGLGSPPANLNPTAGKLHVQYYLEWADGKHFYSTEETTDENGKELRVYRNIR